MADTYFHKPAIVKAVEARELSQIARKHGLNAALLYRLSDGAIDPRKGGEA